MEDGNLNQTANNFDLTHNQPPIKPVPNSLISRIGMLAILIVVAGGAYYLGTLKNKQLTPTNQENSVAQADEAANWKTYKNTALGFELEYPPTAKIDREMNDQYNRATIFKGGNLYFEVMLRKADKIDLDNYYYMDSPITRKTTLAGVDANVYELPNGYCDGPSCSEPYISVVTKKGSDLYHFSFFGDILLSETERQILSTFKFAN